MTGIYRITNQNIQITSIYGDIHERCMAFRVDAKPDYKIATTGADIDAQWEKLTNQDRAEQPPIRSFSEAYMETRAIFDNIAESMPRFDTLVLHGSAVATNGQGFLFLSKRNMLKAFFANLWANSDIGGVSVLLNNDTSMIYLSEKEATVYSVPWYSGRASVVNQSAPLKAICLLESAKKNHIDQLDFHTSHSVLLRHSFSPIGEYARFKRLNLVNTLLKYVEMYRFECNMDSEAVPIGYHMMNRS